jgi:hypothetical protein
MAISKDNKQFLDLISRSTPVLDEWCKISNSLTVFAQNRALDMPDLVEFNLNRNRVAFVRLTEKGKKVIKRR